MSGKGLSTKDQKHLDALKKLLAEVHGLELESLHVEFDASGRMHVTAKKNRAVALDEKGENYDS
jgi:hypothetical protein